MTATGLRVDRRGGRATVVRPSLSGRRRHDGLMVEVVHTLTSATQS